MDITSNERNLQSLYGLLDQVRSILPIVQADFKVQAGPVLVPMPPDQVAALKARHNALVQQIKQVASGFPTL